MFCHKEIIERLEKMKKEINLSIDCAIGFIKGIDIVSSTPFDIKALIDDEDIIVLPNSKTKSQGKSTEWAKRTDKSECGYAVPFTFS